MVKNKPVPLLSIEKNKKLLKLVKGLKDQLPVDSFYWNKIINTLEALTQIYGFDRIETPLIENQNLFSKMLGKNTCSIKDALCSFTDDNENTLCLRSEFTPSVIRSYLEHGFFNHTSQPYKMYSFGPVFRKDTKDPTKYKQFQQFNCEIIGDKSSVADSQLIILAYNFLKKLGIDVNIHVNSLGCKDCNKNYNNQLVQYFKQKRKELCSECKKEIIKSPEKIFDCNNEECINVRVDSPQIVDIICDKCKDHFIKVLEYLDELELSYVLNPYLRKEQSYYSKTVFELREAVDDENGKVFGGGGRYDNLVKEISGIDSPGSGFAINLDEVAKFLSTNEKQFSSPTIFLAQLGELARKKAFVLFEKLRESEIAVMEDFTKDGLKLQLERANKMKAKYVLVIGQKEVLDDTVIIRDMDGGIQEIVDYRKVIPEVRKRLLKLSKSDLN